jgi:hypothetical protein
MEYPKEATDHKEAAMEKPESLPTVTLVDRPLYWSIIIILGIIAVVAVGFWGYTIVQDKTMPDGLTNLLSAIVGGFLGALVPAATSRATAQN